MKVFKIFKGSSFYRQGNQCRANQWTGFYMITVSVMKELKKIFVLLNFWQKSARCLKSENTENGKVAFLTADINLSLLSIKTIILATLEIRKCWRKRVVILQWMGREASNFLLRFHFKVASRNWCLTLFLFFHLNSVTVTKTSKTKNQVWWLTSSNMKNLFLYFWRM